MPMARFPSAPCAVRTAYGSSHQHLEQVSQSIGWKATPNQGRGAQPEESRDHWQLWLNCAGMREEMGFAAESRSPLSLFCSRLGDGRDGVQCGQRFQSSEAKGSVC